ncbi:hypothetical protein K0B96_06870 [Horticoccus luteus]|uniref:Calx-beta domain-containing protein n=1 Tax=Horticoccus luteus TaxID=2862869 RepID=A0A8F9TY84_9BACT|nr:Calx-beta domain-containing protein [Horticoccus luteus]QYM80330.1 hypothetical protein K0B96_06870 [Horticoccus luteus]
MKLSLVSLGFLALLAGFASSASAATSEPLIKNLSSRGPVGSGAGVMIAGFVIGGDAPKDVLVRAVGPGLTHAGVSDALARPNLQLFDAQGRSIVANQAWNAALKSSFTAVGAFPLADGSNDAALHVQLAPGAYTAQVSGVAGNSGVALVEVYDMEGNSRLLNVSTRANVETGSAILISGLVIGPGDGARRLLVRAAGPALKELGVSGALSDPTLAILNSAGTTIITNDNWSNQTAVDAVNSASETVGAFAFRPGSKDAATVAELAPDSYTIQVAGVGGQSGVALVEIYDLGAVAPLPNISVTATVPTTTVASASPAVFTLTRNGDVSAPLSVSYTIGGTAAASADYAPLAGHATFAAGSSQTTVEVIPANGTPGSVALTLAPTARYTISDLNSAEVSIAPVETQSSEAADTTHVQVSLLATATSTATGGTTGVFTFTRAGSTDQPLTISYVVAGSATAGIDYETLPGSVTFAAGRANISVNVVPRGDHGGTVKLTLLTGSTYEPATPSSATVTIAPPALPTITIAATKASVQSGSGATGLLTFTRTGPVTKSLSVNYSVSGTAVAGRDYTALSGTAAFAAGATTATVTITPTNVGSGTVIVSVTSTSTYNAGSTASGSVTLLAPLPVVNVTAATSLTRAGGDNPGVFEITRTGPTDNELTIAYNVSGSAVADRDYAALSGSAIFLAGSATATFNVVPSTSGSGTVTVVLKTGTDREIGAAAVATITILPALPVVEISAPTPSTEAGSSAAGVLQLTRTGSTASSLTVTLTVGGNAAAGADYAALPSSVTFQSGSASASIKVASAANGSGTVTVAVAPAATYALGHSTAASVEITAPPPAPVAEAEAASYSRASLTWDAASIDARLGPTFTDLNPGVPDTRPLTFKPTSTLLTTAEAKKYSYRVSPYELGTPGDDFANYWSCSGQVAYVPDDTANDPGLDRVQTFAYYNKVWALSPRLDPGNSKPHPDPQTRDPNQIAVNGGQTPMQPIAMVRNYGIWQNEALILYRGGFLGIAGTQTSRGGSERPYPAFKFPANKVPTAIAVTTSNEFALVTIWDTDLKQGQLAVIALEGKFLAYHTWPYMGLVNQGSWSDFKVLGYVDLPMTSPNAVAAAANSWWSPSTVSGRALSQIDLSDDHNRQLVYDGDWQAIVAKGGYAIVTSTEDNKAVILDLTPLFQYMRESYLSSAASFQRTIATRGSAPEQFPQAFSVRPDLTPKIVWSADIPAPTCVLAGQKIDRWSRDIYKGYIASRDGTVHIIDTSSLMNRSTWQTGGALREIGTFKVGRNPVAMVPARYNISNLPLIPATASNGSTGTSDPLNNLLHIACRGERSIDTVVTYKGTGTLFRRIQDARVEDPVGLGVADRGNILSVADFHGRKIHNFRLNTINDTRNGVVYGCGANGTDAYEYAGSMSVNGMPFLVNSANVN